MDVNSFNEIKVNTRLIVAAEQFRSATHSHSRDLCFITRERLRSKNEPISKRARDVK